MTCEFLSTRGQVIRSLQFMNPFDGDGRKRTGRYLIEQAPNHTFADGCRWTPSTTRPVAKGVGRLHYPLSSVVTDTHVLQAIQDKGDRGLRDAGLERDIGCAAVDSVTRFSSR